MATINVKNLAMITGVLIVIYLLLGSITPKDAKKTATVALIDNPYETNSYYTTTTSAWMNQKFTAPSAFTMSGVNLMIEKNGGTGMHVEIRNTATATVVATVDQDMSSVATGKQIVYVPISTPLTAGTIYSLQMRAIGGNMRVYYSNANPYSGGNMGMNWVYSDANDMYFQVMYDNGASAGTCTGTTPTNAQLCAGDDVVIVDTPITLTTACSAAMCEYTCNAGFVISGGACVPETSYTCTGTPPTDATMCSGDEIVTSNTPISLVDLCGSAQCEYLCNAGFTKSGSVCVANTITCQVTFQEFIDRANAWVSCGSDTCN